MRKLRLDIEQLKVDSFSALGEPVKARGTVEGRAMATYACTAGWDGCAVETVGATCDVLCSHTHMGPSCDYVSCEGYFYCPPDWTLAEGCTPDWTINYCPDRER